MVETARVRDDRGVKRHQTALTARLLFRFGGVLFAGYLVLAGAQRASSVVAATRHVAIPSLPSADWRRAFLDDTPTPVTISMGWQRLHVVVPAWRLLSDRTLWLRMRFDNWNTAPPALREAGLTEMFRRYGGVLEGPAAWMTMDAFDWDAVPHPVRAMAVLVMIDHRVATAAPAGAYGIPVEEIADTVSAIVMVESWFEHRAVNINSGGDRDLGLAQASEFCRRRLDRLSEQGEVECRLSDQDYFDPWKASGVAATWFLRMLVEAEGDLGLAVRAYHRGIAAARAGAGRAYLEQVEARKAAFLRNGATSPSWRFALARAEAVMRETDGRSFMKRIWRSGSAPADVSDAGDGHRAGT